MHHFVLSMRAIGCETVVSAVHGSVAANALGVPCGRCMPVGRLVRCV